jgi:hypothetical protein
MHRSGEYEWELLRKNYIDTCWHNSQGWSMSPLKFVKLLPLGKGNLPLGNYLLAINPS